MSEGYKKADLERIGETWVQRIKAAEKREEKWIKEAENAEKIYACGMSEDGTDGKKTTDSDLLSYNILHSNVETIVPAIINSPPSPDIRPRYALGDKDAKEAARALERIISTDIDDNALDTEMEGCAQDAFLAGRGIVRVRYDFDEIEKNDQTVAVDHRVEFEVVSWRDYREGPAKRYKDLPWQAFRHEVTPTQIRDMENPELREAMGDADEIAADQTIWEIWCRETGRVYIVIEATARVVNIIEDPLNLRSFFPAPEPVQPIKMTGKRIPVCPFTVYKSLAEELDRATSRIAKIMSGLRVRGIIAGDATAIDILSELDDNELRPVANLEQLAAVGGLDKAVMWWPVDQAIAVLKYLYEQREMTKAAIYEITGISDIVRGQSAASETATAQQIKTQWGSLRIRKMQNLIARLARDLIKLAAEIIGEHFPPDALIKKSGLQLTPQVLQLLNDPLQNYRIDIETDSTIRADLTKSRTEMSEFLRGTAEFFRTMAPIVQQSPAAMAPLATMYGAFARQFNLGKDAEDSLDEFIQLAEHSAKQPRPDPGAEERKESSRRFDAEMMLKKAELMEKRADRMGKQKLGEQEFDLKEIQATFNALKELLNEDDNQGGGLVPN